MYTNNITTNKGGNFMGLFDQFPYTNFHELNLTWILEALKEIQTTTEQFVAINSLKYADPIQWNITSQYEKNTIVIDPQTGTAYISVQPVPTGVILTNTDYWSVVFDLERFVTQAAQNFTSRYESTTTLNATFPTPLGEWLIWNDTLYVALTNIVAGDQYVVDSNIRHFTMEDLIGHLSSLTTNDKTSIVNALNEINHKIQAAITPSDQGTNTKFDAPYGQSALFWWNNSLYRTTQAVSINEDIEIGVNCEPYDMETFMTSTAANIQFLRSVVGNLNDLTTTDKSNLVNAINEIAAQVLGKIGDLLLLTTTDKSNLVNAINEVDGNEKALKQEVGNLNDITIPSPTDFADAINKDWARTLAVEHRVDMYHTIAAKKVILISDSYGVSPTAAESWEMKFLTYTRITNYYRFNYPGKGFYTNGVNGILNGFSAEDVQDKAAITDIIVCLGANDIATVDAGNIGNLINAIVDFCDYCEANYPNAEIFIGMCGYVIYGMPAAGSASIAQYLNVLAAYQLGAASGNAHYLNGVEYPLHYYPNLNMTDGIHPTYAGATALGRAIAGAWYDGSYSYKGDGEFMRLTPIAGGKIAGNTGESFCGLVYIENENTWWEGFAANFDFSGVGSGYLEIGNTYTKIADIDPKSIYGNGLSLTGNLQARCIVVDIDPTKYINIPMMYQIRNKALYLKSLYIDSGVFETHQFKIVLAVFQQITIMTLTN